jgi:hypothetical protein
LDQNIKLNLIRTTLSSGRVNNIPGATALIMVKKFNALKSTKFWKMDNSNKENNLKIKTS